MAYIYVNRKAARRKRTPMARPAGVRRAENAALHTKETALRPENNGAFDHAI